MNVSIMSKSRASTPSNTCTPPDPSVSPGFGSWRLEKDAKPFSASSTANLSSLSGRSSQSEKRFQRLANVRGSPDTASSRGKIDFRTQTIENSRGAGKLRGLLATTLVGAQIPSASFGEYAQFGRGAGFGGTGRIRTFGLTCLASRECRKRAVSLACSVVLRGWGTLGKSDAKQALAGPHWSGRRLPRAGPFVCLQQ